MSIRQRSTSGRLPLRKLGIVLLVLTLAVGAGCTSVLDDGGSGGDANLVENVPAEQNVLIEGDMDLLSDETTQRLFEESGSDGEDSPSQSEMQAGFAYVEAETGLDPRDVKRVMIFGQTDEVTDVQNPTDTSGENERVGILVSTDWSEDEITQAFQETSESSLEAQSYGAQEGVLYRVVESGSSQDDPAYLGVLGSGTFVIGDEAAVRSSLDTEYDGATSLSGDLLDAYENTRDGYVSAAVLVPEGDRSSQMGEMRAMTGVYYTDGNSVGLEGRIIMGSEEEAKQLQQLVSFGMMSMQDDPETAQLLENLDVAQDGSDVTFTYESDVETLLEASES